MPQPLKWDDWIKQRIEIARTEWFKEHNPEVGSQVSNHIRWRRPDTTNYLVDYTIIGQNLVVTGDLGSAVYKWSQILTWEFLLGCDLHYMLEKCEASEVGRQFVCFQQNVAQQHVNDALRDAGVQLDVEGSNREEFGHWLEEHQMDLGPDWWEHLDGGDVPHYRGIGHWVGLQMAIPRIKEQII